MHITPMKDIESGTKAAEINLLSQAIFKAGNMTNTSLLSNSEATNKDNSFPRFPRAFMSVSREELSDVLLTIKDSEGNDATLPQDLQGHIFINSFAGTVASQAPENRSPHAIPKATVMPGGGGSTALFNGDGMVYRIDFHQVPSKLETEGKARLTSRLIKTPAFFADQITHNNEKYEDFQFYNIGISRISLLGSCNQLNTALLPVKFSSDAPSRLLVTNDASRPYEIDPCSLKIVAPVGNIQDPSDPDFKSVWAPLSVVPGVFELVMSSAHPCIDFSSDSDTEKAELFTVSDLKAPQHLIFHRDEDDKSMSDRLFLIRWTVQSSGKEELHNWQVNHKGRPVQILQSTHMLGITENYVIIADTAMKLEQKQTILLLGLRLINSILRILGSTGEKRNKQIDDLKDGFEFLLNLGKLSVHKSSSFIKILARFFIKRIVHIHPEIVTETANSKSDKNVFSVLNSIDKDLENDDAMLQKRAVESFYEKSELEENSILDRIQEAVERTAFLKFLDGLKRSAISIKNEVVEELIEKLRLSIASEQNLDTPLYIIKRSDLNSKQAKDSHSIEAQRVEVPGAFAHLLTDYSETENGEIVIIAPMTDAFDPGEYMIKYDSPQLLEDVDITDLAGTLPTGMDSDALALIKVKPTQPGDTSEIQPEKYELTFEEIKNKPKYINNEIYTGFREDPLCIGLYTYRTEHPKITDVYVMQGGGYPELLTEYIYELYKNYSPKRKVSVETMLAELKQGTPMILTHAKVCRENPANYLEVMQTYEFKPGIVVFSLQFVPRANTLSHQGDEGYVVCTIVQSDELYASQTDTSKWSDNSEIWIFDTKNLSEGPKYKLSHPSLNFGMTLHSVWLDKIAPAPQQDYSFQQDYGASSNKFIESYVEANGGSRKVKNHNQKLLEDLFQEIALAFDEYRAQ